MAGFGYVWVRDAMNGDEPAEVAPTPAPDEATVVEEDVDPTLYRRGTVVGLATLGLGGVITGMVAIPVAGIAVMPAFVDQGTDDIDIGPMQAYPEGEFVGATFLSAPEQVEVARRSPYVRNNGFKDGQPSFTILSNTAPLRGRPAQVNCLSLEAQKQLVQMEH